jgi:hypothetical protein
MYRYTQQRYTFKTIIKGAEMKYKLDIKRDIDQDEEGGLMLWLPFGFRFYNDLVHVRGFDNMQELKQAAKEDVILCDCQECAAHKRGAAVAFSSPKIDS